MQTRPTETPRPRPPAKIRRSLAKGSTTPPPAYASTFPFPGASNNMDGIALGNKWDGGDASGEGNGVDSNQDDDLSWLNEKSRDELTDLLVKADALIKERENELSLTSAACKTLYENNVTLKTKHEALLNRMPLSPNINTTSISSPDLSPRMSRSPLQPPLSLGRSASEALAGNPSLEHMLPKSYNYRRGAGPTVDISFLADQNAELLSKLEKLEAEASSADMVGRRELRRLEKEIGVLKEELEKTQARSDELEEKAKTGFGLGAEKVIEEAWRRKKEREQKLNAVRRAGRVVHPAAQNFAPDPPSLFPAGITEQYSGPDLSTSEEAYIFGEDATVTQDTKHQIQPDQKLMAKLLEKIQELETTNSKILEHQTETTSRLQAVQRETEFMTRVYERLNELEEQSGVDEDEARDQVPSGLANSFAKSHRALQSQLLAAKVKRQRSFHKHDSRSRGSVKGLFDDPPPDTSTPNKVNLPVPFSETSWYRPRHQSAYSIGSGGLASPALSTLSLYSPPTRNRDELSSDIPMGPSLAKELGDTWGSVDSTNLLRPRSLSDLSGLSASPSSYPQPLSQEQGDERDTLPTPPNIPTNSLQLSIEPPTPQKNTPLTKQQESLLIGNMSPRFRIARSLRARNYLYIEGRYPEPLGPKPLYRRKRFAFDDSSPTPTRGPSGGPLFVEGFQIMMDEFDEQSTGVQRESQDGNISRSPSPDNDDYADAKEELDEADREDAIVDVSVDSTGREEEGGSFDEDMENSSLTSRSQKGEVAKSRFARVMIEVWMWLQFVIIMLVFVWAMARKGPKSVLRDAERKRTLSIKKRV